MIDCEIVMVRGVDDANGYPCGRSSVAPCAHWRTEGDARGDLGAPTQQRHLYSDAHVPLSDPRLGSRHQGKAAA
jgi:hypothetical protein